MSISSGCEGVTAGKATLANVSADADQTPQASPASGPDLTEYRESLRTPWWWYPVGIAVATILAAEFHLPGYSLTDWIPYLSLPPLSVAIVWSLGRSKLTVSATELAIRGAHIPLRYVS